jgi:chemotaxis protein MotB
MKHQSHPVIVVRKKKGKHGDGHHGGSWKIAYADFMTAMMALFLVLWLIAISSPKALVSIAEYFRTPLSVAINKGTKSSDSTSPIPGGGKDPIAKEGEIHQVNSDNGKRKEEQDLQRLKDKIEQMLINDPRLRILRPHLQITLTDMGLRIQIIDSQNRPMFLVGSANVEPYMRDILRALAPILDEFPNRISLAGHTDDTPYANGEKGYSNWELSTDRANASRREMIAGGLNEGKILRVLGMGSTMQVKDHQADEAINRRISILVLNKNAEKAIEKENSEGDAITISDAGDLKKMVPNPPPAQSAPAANGGNSVPQQPKTETAKPVAPSGAVTPAAAPAAGVTATPNPSTSRDSQQR